MGLEVVGKQIIGLKDKNINHFYQNHVEQFLDKNKIQFQNAYHLVNHLATKFILENQKHDADDFQFIKVAEQARLHELNENNLSNAKQIIKVNNSYSVKDEQFIDNYVLFQTMKKLEEKHNVNILMNKWNSYFDSDMMIAKAILAYLVYQFDFNNDNQNAKSERCKLLLSILYKHNDKKQIFENLKNIVIEIQQGLIKNKNSFIDDIIAYQLKLDNDKHFELLNNILQIFPLNQLLKVNGYTYSECSTTSFCFNEQAVIDDYLKEILLSNFNHVNHLNKNVSAIIYSFLLDILDFIHEQQLDKQYFIQDENHDLSYFKSFTECEIYQEIQECRQFLSDKINQYFVLNGDYLDLSALLQLFGNNTILTMIDFSNKFATYGDNQEYDFHHKILNNHAIVFKKEVGLYFSPDQSFYQSKGYKKSGQYFQKYANAYLLNDNPDFQYNNVIVCADQELLDKVKLEFEPATAIQNVVLGSQETQIEINENLIDVCLIDCVYFLN